MPTSCVLSLVRRRMDGGIGRSSGHDSSIKCQQTRLPPPTSLPPPHRPPIWAAARGSGSIDHGMSGIASLPVGRWAAIHTACRTPTPSSAACPPGLVSTDTSVLHAMGHGRDGVVGLLPCCPTPCRRGATAGRYPERATRRGPSRPSMRCRGRDWSTRSTSAKDSCPHFLSLSSFLPTTQRGVGVLLTGGVRIHVASQHKVGKRNLDGWRRDRDGHAPALDPCQAAIFCAALSLFSTTPLLSSGSRLFFFSCSWSCTCDSWNLFPCQAGG